MDIWLTSDKMLLHTSESLSFLLDISCFISCIYFSLLKGSIFLFGMLWKVNSVFWPFVDCLSPLSYRTLFVLCLKDQKDKRRWQSGIEILFWTPSWSVWCVASVVAAGSAPPDRGADLWHGGERQPAWECRPFQRCLPVLLPAHLCQVAVPGRLFWSGHSGHWRTKGRKRPASSLPGTTSHADGHRGNALIFGL